MNNRLRALLRYVAPRVPTSTHLRVVTAFSDFKAYQHLGHSITETAWRKGHEFTYPDGMTERSWHRETARIFRQARPLALVLAGDVIAAYALLKVLRRG